MLAQHVVRVLAARRVGHELARLATEPNRQLVAQHLAWTIAVNSKDMALEAGDIQADLIVANMVLMDVVDLTGVLAGLRRIARPGGVLIVTITHPAFWPLYWGYEKSDWFDYWREIVIEAEFNITKQKSHSTTTHIHRPIERYLNEIVGAGFSISQLRELRPSVEVEREYPGHWYFPRFLGIEATAY